MSMLRTYKQALLALAAALALALASVGVMPSVAWASVGTGALGVNVEVPSTIEQRPGSSEGAVKGGSGSLLGVNVQVPDRPSPGGDAGGKTSGASSLLGVNLEVPSTIEQRPGGDDDSVKGGSSSLLGVNLSVPDPAAPDPEDPDDPGDNTVGKVTGTGSLLGVNLEVPSTIEQRPGEEGAGGSEAVLGVTVKVPEGAFVSFYANGGQGTQMVQMAGHKGVSADLSRFSWPGREIVGWYASPACRDDEWVMAPDGVVPEGFMKAGAKFYAKWSVTDPRVVGTVELHLVESEATGGNDTYIPADELAACGIQPAGYAMDDALTAEDAAPVYAGGWYPGGDGTVWPLSEDADEATRELEGATLALPTPVMEERVDETGVRNGIFEGWYKTRTEVTAPDGTHLRYDYADPVEQVDGRWSIGKFDAGSGADGEPPYHQVLWAKWRTGEIHTFTFDADGGAFADGSATKAIQVADGEAASKGSVDEPTREGWTFTGWWTAPDGEPRQKYAFSTPVRHPTTVYAGWEKVRYVIEFDSAGGSAVASRTVEHGDVLERPTDPTRFGYAFVGWFADSDGDGVLDDDPYDFSQPVTGSFKLTAAWEELGPGEHAVVFNANGGVWENGPGSEDDETQRTVTVADGSKLDEPEPPKRAGYQHVGWVRSDGTAWDFEADEVTGEVVLLATWGLRLDVTVPVSVGFAVDPGTGGVTPPEAGRYALKSRTVAAVTVDELGLVSRESDIKTFFSLGSGATDWDGALAQARLAIAAGAAGAAGSAGPIELALGGNGSLVDVEDVDGATFRAWVGSHALTAAERGVYRIAAFDYAAAGTPFVGDSWAGEEECERLPLDLAMTLPVEQGLLAVNDIDGPVPITHLKVTVSATE